MLPLITPAIKACFERQEGGIMAESIVVSNQFCNTAVKKWKTKLVLSEARYVRAKTMYAAHGYNGRCLRAVEGRQTPIGTEEEGESESCWR